MNRRWRFLFAAVSFGVGISALAGALPNIPAAAAPTVKCIRRVLESSNTVQSVSLYSIDGFRFAAEYVFRDKDNQAVLSDIELLIAPDGAVTETDKIPREISKKTANEAEDLEIKLDLNAKCQLTAAFDNLYPQPKARADWQKIDWPNQ